MESLPRILAGAIARGFSGSSLAFGMGGRLLQHLNRDPQKFAYKCCWAALTSIPRSTQHLESVEAKSSAMNSLVYWIGIIVIIFWGSLIWIRSNLQDDSVPEVHDFKGQRFMFVFPHPDDEITSAGLIKLLGQQGVEATLITLTRGEAGDSNGLIDDPDPVQEKLKLGQLRTRELEAVSQRLGIAHLEIFDFPDGGLNGLAPEDLKSLIQAQIEHYRPTVLVTYDEVVGLYGHPDHRITAAYVKDIFLQNYGQPSFPVKQLFQVTLPKPMIQTALKISDTFHQNEGISISDLPAPTFAVKMSAFGQDKRDAMLLHQSQKRTFDDMQPFFDRLPPWLYFRLFDKEYFTEVKPRR
jgi:LmbE family N-acetylglucosaminyl deacetylase